MAYPMGLGKIGESNIVFKRKFRWLFSVSDICVDGASARIPETYVKAASRPNITFDEQEVHFLHGRMYLPGKPTFETITVTYYDVVDDSGNAQPLMPLYSWLSSVYDMFSAESVDAAGNQNPRMGNAAGGKTGYGGVGNLTMLNGTGKAIESWQLWNCWPQAVNFGDLDYSSAEEATIELTLRYAYATWKNYCGATVIKPCFTQGCGSDGAVPGSIIPGAL